MPCISHWWCLPYDIFKLCHRVSHLTKSWTTLCDMTHISSNWLYDRQNIYVTTIVIITITRRLSYKWYNRMFWKYPFQRNTALLIMLRAPFHKWWLLIFVYIHHTKSVHIIIIIVICDTFLIGSTDKHLSKECFVSCLVALFVFCWNINRSVEHGISDNKYGSWYHHDGILQLQHMV
jgi:hypothetical protein